MAAARLIGSFVVRHGDCGRTKFIDREDHIFKQSAGIFFFCDYALLVGNTILGCGNQILCRPLEADNRENTNGNDQFVASLHVVNQVSVHAGKNGIRNIAQTAAATAGMNGFNNLAA